MTTLGLGSKLLKSSSKMVASDGVRLSTESGRAGALKEAGNIFSKREDAREAEFFHKKERELIENLRSQMKDQIKFHEEQIKVHQNALEKLKTKEKESKP